MGDDGAAASSAARPAAEAAADSGYPSLRTVPPRPHLSYPVQQQRQIVEALIADRENARYTSEAIRYRAGLSSLPPPPTPPAPAAPVNLEPTVVTPAASPERPLVEEETLLDFLAALFSGDRPSAPVAAEPAPSAPPGESADPATPEKETDGAAPPSAATARAGGPPDDEAPEHVFLPPARSAVAARMTTPGVIDALVDPGVPQAPLPPEQSGLAARLAAAEQVGRAAPLPAPRPSAVRAGLMLGPPPVKPIVPVVAPMPPTPAEKPADARSAAAEGARVPQAVLSDSAAQAMTVANAVP